MQWRRKALLAAIESTYGTDATPTGAANAILAYNVNLTPIDAQDIERDFTRDEKGAFPRQLVGKHVSLAFDVALAGAGGAVDDVPAYAPLMRGCGMAQTVNAATSVQFDPVSELEESCSIYLHMDEVRHRLLGARGEVGVEYGIQGRPLLKFAFKGLLQPATDEAFPDADYSGFAVELPGSQVNTPTFTLHGFAARLQTLSLMLGNIVEHRELVNYEAIEILDRAANGSAVFEAVNVATQDYFGAVTAETQGALQLIHGTTAGNIVQVDAPAVQLLAPAYSEHQRRIMFGTNLNVLPNAGDDEIRITTR